MAAVCPRCEIHYSSRDLRVGLVFECHCGITLRVPETATDASNDVDVQLLLHESGPIPLLTDHPDTQDTIRVLRESRPPLAGEPPAANGRQTPGRRPSAHVRAQFGHEAELIFDDVDSHFMEQLQSDVDEAGEDAQSISSLMEHLGLDGGVELPEQKRDETSETARELTERLLSGPERRRYGIGRKLKTGGMGAIFLARDLNIRRMIAMKVLLAPEKATRQQVLRFVEEAQVTGQLEHPNIVPVYELAVAGAGNVFYTMKFVKGVTLESVLQAIREAKGVMVAEYPLAHLLTIFLKVCDAVAFAHSRDVIHRDLKPENVMIGEYGEVLVMDWGLAKVIGRGSAPRPPRDSVEDQGVSSVRDEHWGGSMHTLDGQILGTPQFMSPEQAQGKVDELDERTDIYGLGAILYEILTLRPAVAGDNLKDVLQRIIDGDILPPDAFNSGTAGRQATEKEASADKEKKPERQIILRHCPQRRIPESLSAVCMKALATDREQRYQSVQALQRDIEAYLGGYATQAEQASPLKQLSLLVRRHRTEFGLVATGLLLIAVIVTAFVRQLQNERNEAFEMSQQAVSALQRLRAEQDARRELSKAATPEFLRKANKLLQQGDWKGALEAANIAISLDYRNEEAWHLKGRLHLGRQELRAASEAFKRTPGLNRPGVVAVTRKYAGRIDKDGEPLSTRELIALAQEVRKAGDLAVAEHLYRTARNARAALEARFEGARKSLIEMNPLQRRLHFTYKITGDDVALDLSGNSDLANIGPLQGLPLTNLDLSSTKVRTLAAIERVPLRVLKLTNTKVRRLDALRRMPLKEVDLQYTEVIDFSGLQGLKLERLNAAGTQFGDFDVNLLAQMPLKELILANTEVSDLTVLRGMPLRRLDLSYTNVRSIAPLSGMVLEELDISYTPVSDLGPLLGLRLKRLALSGTRVSELNALAGMPLVSLDVSGTKVDSLAPLAGMPLSVLDASHTAVKSLAPLKGRPLKELRLEATRIDDVQLRLLSGLPLERLALSQTKVADLAPLRGMPLVELGLGSTHVRDLGPLTGMKLKILDLSNTPVTDLSVVLAMPLVDLRLDDCSGITDLTPLTACPTLQRLIIPAGARNVDRLRELPRLEFLSTVWARRAQTAAEFWRNRQR